MKLRSALLVATVLVAPFAAKAQPVTGLYVGAGVGFNYLDNPSINRITPFVYPGTAVNVAGNTIKTGHYNTFGGPIGLASVGFGLGNGLRFELEGDYRFTHYKLKNASNLGGGGDLQSYGPMVNVLYDFALPSLPVTPYVGVGGGYQFVSQERASVYRVSGVSNTLSLNQNSYGVPAVQAILGVAYNVRAVPGLAFTAEYRFMATVESEKFRGSTSGSSVLAAGRGTEKIGDNYNHAGLLGIRYNFGVGAPPPPPAVPVATPAATPARSYLVFFDWDRADLTARARQIIAEAAQTSTKVSYTKIQVSGNADRSGTPQYNQRLSLRRAENVAAELVKDGVPRTAIDIQAYGDTRPLVPTAAGVREPQNRRVEIVLQ